MRKAEEIGFEPTEPLARLGCFPSNCHKPLGHSSSNGFRKKTNGEPGIRTLGATFVTQQFSKLSPSATRPALLILLPYYHSPVSGESQGGYPIKRTERVGFEPTVPFDTLVFKTRAINHSTTFPQSKSAFAESPMSDLNWRPIAYCNQQESNLNNANWDIETAGNQGECSTTELIGRILSMFFH